VVLQLLLLQELLLALARAAAAAQLLEALRQVRVQDLLQQLAQLLLAGARAAAAAQLLEALRQVRAQELLQQLARLLLAGAVQASRKPWLLPLAFAFGFAFGRRPRSPIRGFLGGISASALTSATRPNRFFFRIFSISGNSSLSSGSSSSKTAATNGSCINHTCHGPPSKNVV
jgi:hypothetical protein